MERQVAIYRCTLYILNGFILKLYAALLCKWALCCCSTYEYMYLNLTALKWALLDL